MSDPRRTMSGDDRDMEAEFSELITGLDEIEEVGGEDGGHRRHRPPQSEQRGPQSEQSLPARLIQRILSVAGMQGGEHLSLDPRTTRPGFTQGGGSNPNLSPPPDPPGGTSASGSTITTTASSGSNAMQHRQMRILEINRRQDITPEKKQELIRNEFTSSGTPPALLVENGEESAKVVCEHYPNKKCAAFFFECCGTYDSCVRCHRENRRCPRGIQPAQISSILCLECNLRQPSAAKCSNAECKVQFGKNHCTICKIFTELDVFHCEKCTICRVGKQEEVTHCDNCGTCMPNFHTCCDDPSTGSSYREAKCGFCLGNVFDSQLRHQRLPRCGHYAHMNCIDLSIEAGEYRCPQCRKTMYMIDWSYQKAMIRSQPMPHIESFINGAFYHSPYGAFRYTADRASTQDDSGNSMIYGELINFILSNGTHAKCSIRKSDVKYAVNIICNDCGERSNGVPYHFIGNQCPLCESFNTVEKERSPWGSAQSDRHT